MVRDAPQSILERNSRTFRFKFWLCSHSHGDDIQETKTEWLREINSVIHGQVRVNPRRRCQVRRSNRPLHVPYSEIEMGLPDISIYPYIYIYLFIFIYLFMYICIYIYKDIYIDMHICICTYLFE